MTMEGIVEGVLGTIPEDILEEIPEKMQETIQKFFNSLPCSSPYFEGDKTWKNGDCISKGKCEYINGMGHFIKEVYPCYTLLKCLDIDKRNKPQPEALLMSKTGEYIAIEVKCMPDPQFLESSVDKTNMKNQHNCFFWNDFIDDSALKAEERFIQSIRECIPNITNKDLEFFLKQFFKGIYVIISPVGNNFSIQDLVYQERKSFKPFLINEMATYSQMLLRKTISKTLQSKDLYRTVSFKDKLKLRLVLTKSNNVYFQIHDATSCSSLREYLRINEEGVIDFLNEFIISCDRKFKELNKETFTHKNIFLLSHRSTLSKATDVIEKCLNKLNVPNSIHEIWVTDHLYESIYNDDGIEIGEQIVERRYRKIYDNY